MTIFYIKMKIRAGGGSFRAAGGAQGAPPAIPLYGETLGTLFSDFPDFPCGNHLFSKYSQSCMTVNIWCLSPCIKRKVVC